MSEEMQTLYRALLVKNLDMKKVRPYGYEHDNVRNKLKELERDLTAAEIIENTNLAFIK